MRVADWLERYPEKGVAVAPDAELDAAARAMLAEPGCRDVYVVDDHGRVVGHVSFRRLAGLLLAEHRPVHTRRQLLERAIPGSVSDFMEKRFVHARPGEFLDEAIHRHMEFRVEDMPVLDADHRLLGVVKIAEVLRAIIRDADSLGGGPVA